MGNKEKEKKSGFQKLMESGPETPNVPRETFGAIDIGSNAIRLLISYVETYSDKRVECKKAAFVRIPIRLGDDVFESGRISKVKVDALNDALRSFASLMRAYEVKDYRACATCAMREAQNGEEVVGNIKSQSGLDVEIISGDEEAETIFAAGGLKEVLDAKKNYAYVDVGGGSTEVIIYANGERVEERSFKLGTVRMLIGKASVDEWEEFKSWLKEMRDKWKPAAVIGSGGNINKVHKMLEKKSDESVKAKEVRMLFDLMRKLTVTERMEKLYLNQSRAEVIVFALKIFCTVVDKFDVRDILVPRVGLVDGIVRGLIAKNVKAVES